MFNPSLLDLAVASSTRLGQTTFNIFFSGQFGLFTEIPKTISLPVFVDILANTSQSDLASGCHKV